MLLQIEANTAQELRAKVFEIAETYGYAPTEIGAHAHSVGSVDDSNEPLANVAPNIKRNKPGRKPNGETVTRTAEDAVAKAGAKTKIKDTVSSSELDEEGNLLEKKETTHTKEDVIKALQSVNESKGLPAAREILKQFGAARVSDLAPDKYTEFVTICTNTCAGAEVGADDITS